LAPGREGRSGNPECYNEGAARDEGARTYVFAPDSLSWRRVTPLYIPGWKRGIGRLTSDGPDELSGRRMRSDSEAGGGKE